MGLKLKYNNLLLGTCRQCNLMCPFCCTKDWRRDATAFPISLEIVDYFYNRFEFKKIKLHGPGETTMCPNFDGVLTRIMTLFKEIPIELFSNGLVHDYSWWENLFLKIDSLNGKVKVILSPKIENPQSMEWLENMPFRNNDIFLKGVLTEDNATLWSQAVSIYPNTLEKLLNPQTGHFEVDSNPSTNVEQIIQDFNVGASNAIRGCHEAEDDHSIIVTAWEPDCYIIEQTYLQGSTIQKTIIPGIEYKVAKVASDCHATVKRKHSSHKRPRQPRIKVSATDS